MALSMQQLMDAAKQAGFSGPALAQAVAIAWAESHGNGAQSGYVDKAGNREQSYGVTQINVPSHPDLNIDVDKLQQDPVYAFRLMDQISYGGQNFGAWTTWSGASTQGAANDAHQYLAQTYQMAGLDPSTAPTSATTTEAGGAGSVGAHPAGAPQGASASTTPNYDLPADAQVFVVDGRMPVVMFDLGDGIWIKYNVSDFGHINPGSYKVTNISSQQFSSMNPVDAGDATALGSVAKTYGTYSSYWDKVVTSVFPPNSPALQDPGVRRVIADAAARPPSDPMSQSEILNRLQATPYVQGKGQTARDYDNATAAEKQQLVQKEAANLVNLWWQNVGSPIDITDPRIQRWATQVASGQTGEGGILYQQIIPTARTNPNSPRARAEQQETVDEHKRGNDITTKQAQVIDLFHQWGIQGDDSLFQKWSTDITDGLKSDGDLQSYLQNQSKILYPWKDPTTPTLQAAQPWMSTYSRVFDGADPDGGLFNPDIQKALNNGTPLWQFEQQLKQDPRWLTTKNANDDITQGMAAAGKIMGFD